MQASAEPNDCVKPNEQNRVYSNFAMTSNRTFKNLFGLCRAQPNFRASECNRACSYCRAQPKNIELVKIRATYQVAIKTIENVSCIFVKFVGYKNQGQNYLFSTGHLPAKLTDLPTNIFSYTRAGKPVSSPTIRKIIFIISKILFIICKIIFRLIQDSFCYKLCNMYYKLANMRYKVCNMY